MHQLGKIVSDIKDILEKVLDSLNEGNFLPTVMIILVVFLFNYKKIVEFFEERRKARIVKLNEALECEFIKDQTKKHLEDELAAEHFNIVTGIKLEKNFREALIKTYQKMNGEVAFIHFKRAIPHLYFRNSDIEVKISLFEKIRYLFNFVFGITLAIFGFYIMTSLKATSILDMLYQVGIGLFIFVMSLMMLYQTFSVESARKIQKFIKLNTTS